MLKMSDERRNNMATVMDMLGYHFSRDVIIRTHGERIADQISIAIQQETGFKMLIFTSYSISVDDLSTELLGKIVGLLCV